MRIQSLITGLGLSLVLAAAPSSAVFADSQEPVDTTPDCQASLLPNAIPRQVAPVEVRLTTPLTLGAVEAVEIEEKSGAKAAALQDQEPSSISFKVDTSEAQTGFWTIVLKAEDGECRAVLEIL
ncbi:MAG: hypothetical protein K0U98_13740 [Deltaproteobacteria bacterium]|nr:hypothetical protein [Deltaproteobacteria bacterium]